MSNEITKFDFYGDSLEVAQHVDGKIYVSVRRVCKALGIDSDVQRRKLQAAPWAVISKIKATGTDGKQYKNVMLAVSSLFIWLATIHPLKVHEWLRPKLELYQRECASALNQYFTATKKTQYSFSAHEAIPIQELIYYPETPYGYNYIAVHRRGNRFKIGWSLNPPARVSAMRTVEPSLELLAYWKAGYQDNEAYLHNLFAVWRLEREWFLYTKESIDFFSNYITTLTVKVTRTTYNV